MLAPIDASAATDFEVDTNVPEPESVSEQATATTDTQADAGEDAATTGPPRDDKGRFAKATDGASEGSEEAAADAAADDAGVAEGQPAEDDVDVTTGLNKKARPYKLVRQYQDAAERAARENAQLRAELARISAQAPPTPASAASETVSLQPRPKLNDFASWEEYEAADNQWLSDAIDARAKSLVSHERRTFEQEMAERHMAARMGDISAKGREKYQDFDAVVQQAFEAGAVWSPLMRDVVVNATNAHDLAYALAKDPGEARRLAAMSHPVLFGVEMGQFLSRVTAASSSGPAVPRKVTTQAKPPIKPVAGTVTTASDEPPDADDEDVDKHIAYHNRKEGRALPKRVAS